LKGKRESQDLSIALVVRGKPSREKKKGSKRFLPYIIFSPGGKKGDLRGNLREKGTFELTPDRKKER